MNKTININISGEPFVIDEDAYRLLEEYLDTLAQVFKGQSDSEQIQQDIEFRFAELFNEQLGENRKVVSIDMVRCVIDRIGQPNDFAEIDASRLDVDQSSQSEKCGGCSSSEAGSAAEEISREEPPIYTQQNRYDNSSPLRKRVYRDGCDKILGGVCAGIAHYFNIDPLWIRIIAVLLLFFSASCAFWVYIFCWIAIPLAKTPYQRMQMYGESTSFRNIGKNVNTFADDNEGGSGNPVDTSRQCSETSTSFLSVLLKVIMVILAVMATPLLITFVCLMIADIVLLLTLPFTTSAIAMAFGGIIPIETAGDIWFSQLAIFSLILSFGVPCIALIWCCISMFKKNLTMKKGWIIGLCSAWIVGILLFVIGLVTTSVNNRYRDFHDDFSIVSDFAEECVDNLDELEENIEVKDFDIMCAVVHDGIDSVKVALPDSTE